MDVIERCVLCGADRDLAVRVHGQEVCAAVREVLIAATDIIRPGHEPFVGWSAVLAERIVAALPASHD